MVALFSRWSDAKARLGCGCLLAVLVGPILLLMAWVRSPMQNLVTTQREQPVDFDHRHHVLDDGIDCLYCHYHATDQDTAGLPETALCMGCHVQIWADSPVLDPVYSSWTTGQPIPWRRVHDLPEFVYFSHAVHVSQGIGCESCHGRVDQMASVAKTETMTMGWCLDCHRNPDPHLRPPDQVTVMGYQPSVPQNELAPQLARELGRPGPTHCTACHR